MKSLEIPRDSAKLNENLGKSSEIIRNPEGIKKNQQKSNEI